MKPGDKVMYRLPTRKNGPWIEGRVTCAVHVETLKGQQWRGDLYRVRREDDPQEQGLLFYRDELLSAKDWRNIVNCNQ